MMVLGVSLLIVSLVLLWTGRKRFRFGSFAGALLSALELLGLGIGVFQLEWWGVVAFVVANVVCLMTWSVVAAARVEKKLVYAAVQTDTTKSRMELLSNRLSKRSELAHLGPLGRAELVRLLSERARSPAEIEEMAVPIAALNAVHSAPIAWLVDRCDRLLRLAGQPSAQATSLADTLTAGARASAASFTEMVDGLLAAYQPAED